MIVKDHLFWKMRLGRLSPPRRASNKAEGVDEIPAEVWKVLGEVGIK